MNSVPVSLRKIKKFEFEKAGALLAESFYDDPLYCWLFPDANKRKKNAHLFFEYELCRSAEFTFVTDDIKAIIIIKSPYDKKLPVNPFLSIKLFLHTGIASTVKAIKYLRFCDKCKKQYMDKDMTYLNLLAVSAERRGNGVASDIIKQFSDKSIYLETQNSNNTGYYEKQGFTLIAEKPFAGIKHYILIKH